MKWSESADDHEGECSDENAPVFHLLLLRRYHRTRRSQMRREPGSQYTNEDKSEIRVTRLEAKNDR